MRSGQRGFTRIDSQPRGFTLIEMMVALVLFAAITVGMMSVAVTMTNGYRDQEVTIATEASSRSALDFISNGVRGASPGVANPTQVIQCVSGVPALAVRHENNLAVAGLASTPDALTVVMPIGGTMTTTTNNVNLTGGADTVTVVDASTLSVNDQLLITDHVTGHIVRITAISSNTLTVLSTGCSKTYNAPAVAIRVMRARFSIGFLAGDTVPMLMMDADAEGTFFSPEPIAEGIEDMQIAVGVDAAGNGISNPVEGTATNVDDWLGNVATETLYTTQPNLRALRITLVARTTKEAQGAATYRLPAIEDRAQNAATDLYRRRILTSVVEMRNLGGSP